MSLARWSPLERYLDEFDCIRVGMPRNGGILARQPLLTMRNFASLAGDLLDQLDIERADVLGLSFGGMVAQQLAHDMPTRVRRLVLVSTSCGLGGAPGNPVSWWFAMLADMWPMVSKWSPRGPQRWSHPLRELGARWPSGPRLSGFAEQIAAASLWSSVPWLPQLTQETLVITGTADALVPSTNAGILVSRMPRAHIYLYRVRGGGHLCLLDRAAEVDPLIAAFAALARDDSD